MSFIIFKTPIIIYKTTKFFLFYFSQFLQESSKLKIVSILICTSASNSLFASRCLNIALVIGPCLNITHVWKEVTWLRYDNMCRVSESWEKHTHTYTHTHIYAFNVVLRALWKIGQMYKKRGLNCVLKYFIIFTKFHLIQSW